MTESIFRELKPEEITKERKVLDKVKKLFQRDQPVKLRELSNELTGQVMLTRDRRLMEISLISYALSKILQKPHYRKTEGWKKFKKEIRKELGKSVKKKGMRLKNTVEIIEDFNKEAGNYVRTVLEHARTKQASRLYAMGLSLDSAAELTGANEEELMSYIGSTNISEEVHTTIPVKDRYKKAKKMVKGR